ncbi:MAG: hypothetical protein VXZ32_09670 [Verrucomicrobiota bacterium]|nr:hypothetical protein [Verrucomicrobiota bacterium]
MIESYTFKEEGSFSANNEVVKDNKEIKVNRTFIRDLGILIFTISYVIHMLMQVSTNPYPKKIDTAKELWFFLMFNCIGFTVWPLMIYYLSRTLNVSFFIDLNLRTWAEDIVYGPLGSFSPATLFSLTLLFFPYFCFLVLRILLEKSSLTNH